VPDPTRLMTRTTVLSDVNRADRSACTSPSVRTTAATRKPSTSHPSPSATAALTSTGSPPILRVISPVGPVAGSARTGLLEPVDSFTLPKPAHVVGDTKSTVARPPLPSMAATASVQASSPAVGSASTVSTPGTPGTASAGRFSRGHHRLPTLALLDQAALRAGPPLRVSSLRCGPLRVGLAGADRAPPTVNCPGQVKQPSPSG